MLRYCLFVVWLLAVSPAHAVLTIAICGSSTSTGPGDCSDPKAKVDSGALGTKLEAVKVSQDGKSAVIPLNNTRTYPTPSGWTPPTGGAVQPNPPASAGSPTLTYSTSGTVSTSAAASCSAWAATLTGVVSGAHPGGATSSTMCIVYDGAGAYSGYASAINTISSCPAGYTASGGVCGLTDATQVLKPSDLDCTFIRVGNSYSEDPNDPDCSAVSTSAKTTMNVVKSGGTVTAGTSTTGTVNVTVASDGTATITSNQPTGGNTLSTVLKGGAPGAGGDVLTTGVAQATTAGAGSSNDPGTGVDQCGAPGQPECGVRVNESGTPTGSGAYSTPGTALDSASTARETSLGTLAGAGAVTSLPGFSIGSWLPTAGTCSAFHWDFKGYTYDHDWCPTLSRLRALWAWMVGIIGALYVWRRATSPQSA